MITVAALYVDALGVYARVPGVEAWDIARDARGYDGPHPIVAHPPCGPWGRLRHLCRKDDPQLALLAVEQVRRWGGVLEHPAGSRLFLHRNTRMPLPGELPDAWGGYTIEVCQCDWGHVARKRTWLYLVGVPRAALTFPPPCEPTHQIGVFRFRDSLGRLNWRGDLRQCSAQQRRRTPHDFAEWLVALAREAQSAREAA